MMRTWLQGPCMFLHTREQGSSLVACMGYLDRFRGWDNHVKRSFMPWDFMGFLVKVIFVIGNIVEGNLVILVSQQVKVEPS